MFSTRRDIIGIDLGSASAKAVVLRRNSDGELNLREHAIVSAEPGCGKASLERTITRLLRKLRSRGRDCAVTIWPENSKLRFFDLGTPEAAAAIAHSSPEQVEKLFHEELSGHVAVCGKIENCQVGEPSSICLAEAMPKDVVTDLESILARMGRRLRVLQLTPIALLNAFTSTCLDVARKHPFLVVDFGRDRALVVAGYRGLARVVRVVEFPCAVEARQTASAPGEPLDAQGMEAMQTLFKELVDVCDFVDAQDQHARLDRMHVSGSLSGNAEIMSNLGAALELTCVPWNPLRSVATPERAIKQANFANDLARLPLAAGVAFQCAA